MGLHLPCSREAAITMAPNANTVNKLRAILLPTYKIYRFIYLTFFFAIETLFCNHLQTRTVESKKEADFTQIISALVNKTTLTLPVETAL